ARPTLPPVSACGCSRAGPARPSTEAPRATTAWYRRPAAPTGPTRRPRPSPARAPRRLRSPRESPCPWQVPVARSRHRATGVPVLDAAWEVLGIAGPPEVHLRCLTGLRDVVRELAVDPQ